MCGNPECEAAEKDEDMELLEAYSYGEPPERRKEAGHYELLKCPKCKTAVFVCFYRKKPEEK